MAKLAYIPMVEGDTLPLLRFTYSGVDVTGYTFTFRAKRDDGTILTRAGTITNAASGEVVFTWQAGDVKRPGLQLAEIEITDAAGKVLTVQKLALDVSAAVK